MRKIKKVVASLISISIAVVILDACGGGQLASEEIETAFEGEEDGEEIFVDFPVTIDQPIFGHQESANLPCFNGPGGPGTITLTMGEFHPTSDNDLQIIAGAIFRAGEGPVLGRPPSGDPIAVCGKRFEAGAAFQFSDIPVGCYESILAGFYADNFDEDVDPNAIGLPGVTACITDAKQHLSMTIDVFEMGDGNPPIGTIPGPGSNTTILATANDLMCEGHGDMIYAGLLWEYDGGATHPLDMEGDDPVAMDSRFVAASECQSADRTFALKAAAGTYYASVVGFRKSDGFPSEDQDVPPLIFGYAGPITVEAGETRSVDIKMSSFLDGKIDIGFGEGRIIFGPLSFCASASTTLAWIANPVSMWPPEDGPPHAIKTMPLDAGECIDSAGAILQVPEGGYKAGVLAFEGHPMLPEEDPDPICMWTCDVSVDISPENNFEADLSAVSIDLDCGIVDSTAGD